MFQSIKRREQSVEIERLARHSSKKALIQTEEAPVACSSGSNFTDSTFETVRAEMLQRKLDYLASLSCE
jgi:hypothetical protein